MHHTKGTRIFFWAGPSDQRALVWGRGEFDGWQERETFADSWGRRRGGEGAQRVCGKAPRGKRRRVAKDALLEERVAPRTILRIGCAYLCVYMYVARGCAEETSIGK